MQHVSPAPHTHAHLEELPVLVPEEGGRVALQHRGQLRHAAGGVAKAARRADACTALQLVAEVGGDQLGRQRALDQVPERLQDRVFGVVAVTGVERLK